MPWRSKQSSPVIKPRSQRMAGSVIEQELVRKLTVLGTSMRKHDRGVLMGFLFSLLPILPLAFVGLGIGLFNRSMYRTGKIDES